MMMKLIWCLFQLDSVNRSCLLPVSYDAVEPPPPVDVVKDVEMVSDHHEPEEVDMSEILPVSYDAVEHVVVEPPPPVDVVKDVEMASDHHESEEVVMSGDTWRPLTSVVDASLPEMKVKEKQLVGY